MEVVDKTLAAELAEFKAAFKLRAGPERAALMEKATLDLKASSIERSALQIGDNAPNIALPDATGRQFSISEQWQKGPVVLIFYRGGWCPYCNLELRAWQGLLPALHSLGAGLAAVSPQSPDHSLSTAEKHELAYPVLSDSSLELASAFGVAFDLPPELVELYSRIGNDLPAINGNGKWVLPVPATYVIDTSGRIAFAHIDADYRERAEPSDVLHAVAALSKKSYHAPR